MTLLEFWNCDFNKNYLSGEIYLRIEHGNGKSRSMLITEENLEWALAHYGDYEVELSGVTPFCYAADREDDGIGLPSFYCHLAFLIRIRKPKEEN